MNILVVSESFTRGGLETHINTYYKTLKDKVRYVFAFSSYKDYGYLEDAKIYTGLHLSFNSSIKDFIEDVKKLVEIILNEHIDVVHVHPFYSFFPAVFAANLTNTKIVYTYHGYASINFTTGNNDSVLFMFAMESRINKTFCVANNVLEYFNNMYNHNAIFIPNLIYEDDFPIHKISNNKKWALISRLDSDKYLSIIKFLDILNNLDIDFIDIYGTGNNEKDLKKYLKKNKLDKKVCLKGYINNLNENLSDYTGSIGLGRVVQESLCMNYPTIFIGYGKIAGVVDKKLYDEVKQINFVPAAINDIDIDNLKKQIISINKGNYKEYQLREEVIKDFGKKNTINYLKEIENISSKSLNVLDMIYNDILSIEDDDSNFYTSKSVFYVLYNHLANYSKNIYFKNLLTSNIKYYDLLVKNDESQSLINNIKMKYNELQETINNIENKNSQTMLEIKNEIDNLKTNLYKVTTNNEQLTYENNVLTEELDNYKKGKLYKLSTKIYLFKAKFRKKKR